MSFGIGATNQNRPITAFCWHGRINPLNSKLNPICHFLALLEAYHILHVSRIRVKQPTYQVILTN
jgi:hypothetical protein